MRQIKINLAPIIFNKLILAVILTGGFLMPLSASAELSISGYGGKSFIDNSDLNLKQGQTNLNFKDVSWEDNSFKSPVFYGARVGYWLKDTPNIGFSVDFSHLKNYLIDCKSVAVSGVQNNVPLNGNQVINTTALKEFNMSHGLNTLTFNGQYRWFPTGQRDGTLLGRLQPYTGLGAGFSIPHVEATVYNLKTYEYQFGAGPVVNVMFGLNYDIYSFISGFAEYKLTYASVEDNLKGGGVISTETVNHQLIFGLSSHFDI